MNFWEAVELMRAGKKMEFNGYPYYIRDDKLYVDHEECGEMLGKLSVKGYCEQEWREYSEPDEIFLLSAEEYEEYKDVIPKFDCWWWLRSPGDDSFDAAYVCCDGSVYHDDVIYDDYCVRPVLRLKSCNFPIGLRIIKHNFPWIVIDGDLAIAEVPIATHRFDEKSNNYETSEIRQFLLNWIKNRK